MKKARLILNAVVFCLVIAFFSGAFLILPDKEMSKAERRPLKQFDEVTDGDKHPFEEIEDYLLDQFPMRDTFRGLKTFLFVDVLKKNENNNLYKHEGSVVEIQDKLDETQVEYAADLINKVIDKYFSDDDIFYSIVPDKHFYASKENGYPAMDYEKMFSIMAQKLEDAEYIDITDKLEISDYYKTDSHWSQDKILDVADKLVSSMNGGGTTIIPDGEEFKVNTLSPFYGVYCGQWAMPLKPDEIKYLSSDKTDALKMTVIDDMGKKHEYPVYVTEMFKNNDPYDLFAAGAQHLVIIENPNAENDKELVVFRDSFGSSIAPLLSLGYSKVTFVDLRYIIPDFIKQISGFGDDPDVLFLYSTGLLNGGRILKDFHSLS